MTHILYGEYIGKQGKLCLGCSTILSDVEHSKILLTCRNDNGMWCLPGGMIEAGASVAEGCAREVWEEIGLRLRVIHLTGVHSDPHHVVVYPDGNQAHIVVLNLELELLNGEPNLSNETTGVGWFPVCEVMDMDLFHNHVEHIRDAVAGQDAAFLR